MPAVPPLRLDPTEDRLRNYSRKSRKFAVTHSRARSHHPRILSAALFLTANLQNKRESLPERLRHGKLKTSPSARSAPTWSAGFQPASGLGPRPYPRPLAPYPHSLRPHPHLSEPYPRRSKPYPLLSRLYPPLWIGYPRLLEPYPPSFEGYPLWFGGYPPSAKPYPRLATTYPRLPTPATPRVIPYPPLRTA